LKYIKTNSNVNSKIKQEHLNSKKAAGTWKGSCPPEPELWIIQRTMTKLEHMADNQNKFLRGRKPLQATKGGEANHSRS
jgi:hypothetical protein